MADTRQIVSWSLERKCSFRDGNQWYLPSNTHQQLGDLRLIDSAEGDRRHFQGICVTGWTSEQDYSGGFHDIPDSGMPIEDRLQPLGGLSAIQATCRACEANAKTELAMGVAGCFGTLDIWPESEELDQQLWSIIEEHQLEDRLRSAFPITTPLWFGFWINSPLQRPQAELLLELLDAACDPTDPQDKDVCHFLNALRAAIAWEIPIHVSLAPLGHADCGWYTVFPHCPRCKANAPMKRWQKSYPTTTHECHACGHTFIPDEHHSSEEFDVDPNANSLKTHFGEAEYEQFVRGFLRHRGCSPQQVDEVVDNQNNGPILRRIQETRQLRDTTLARIRTISPAHSELNSPRTTLLTLTDDVEIELVLVPAGEFLMGSPAAAEHAIESPQHLVKIARPFYIGRYPVTQAQWTAVMGTNPSKHQDDFQLPVDRVSWFDCQEFCEQLCNRHRRVIRLPTEAEWEYACRAGTTTKYAFGDTLSTAQANYTPFSSSPFAILEQDDAINNDFETANDEFTDSSDPSATPTPVGQFPPNAWGIYDMHGNVDEWCEDTWHPNYSGAPTDGSAWLDGEANEPFRVVRGGWASASEFVCTSASRRQRRADDGARDATDFTTDPDDEELAVFLETISDMMYTPTGLRVVCEFPG